VGMEAVAKQAGRSSSELCDVQQQREGEGAELGRPAAHDFARKGERWWRMKFGRSSRPESSPAQAAMAAPSPSS